MNLRSTVAGRSTFGGIVWSAALVTSIVGLAAGAVVIVRDVPPLLTALVTSSPDPARHDGLSEVVEQHDQRAKLSKDRFDKRSFFFDPPAPPRPVPKPKPAPPPPPPEPPKEPEPPKAPPKYGGPKPFGMLGETVYFQGNKVIRVGEEKDGVKVLAVRAPWTVTLGWSGGEYEEAVFEGSEKFFGNALSDAATETKGVLPPERASEALDGIVSGSGPTSGGSARLAKPAVPPSGSSEEHGAEGKRGDPESNANGESGEAGDEQPAAPSAPSAHTPLTKEQIAALDRTGAVKALTEVSKAKNDRSIDEATKKVLDEEYKAILDHIKSLNQGQGQGQKPTSPR